MEIYTPTGKAREYSPLALNYFKGCDHGCKYCYVNNMMHRFNSNYKHELVIKPTNYYKIEQSAKKLKGCEKQILLSFTSDPYCHAASGETKEVLEILLKYNHKVAVLTKNPGKALKDISIIKMFGSRFKIGTTLTFDNDIQSKEWEPGAPIQQNRIYGLKMFSEYGVKTWVSFEPVIKTEQTLNLLSKVIKFVDYVKIGKLNNYNGIDKQIDWTKFICNAVEILRDNNMTNRFYIKKDLLLYNKNTYLTNNEINQDYLNL